MRAGLTVLSIAVALVPAEILEVRGADPTALTLADCDALVRDAPDEPDSYACFFSVARRTDAHDDAARRLEALVAIDPDRHWARFHLGQLRGDRGDLDRALELLLETAEGMERDAFPLGASRARVKMAYYLTNARRYEQAETELDRALALAEQADDPVIRAEARVQQGWTALRQGDYVQADLQMRRAEQLVMPDGPAPIQNQVLGGLGAVAWLTGRLGEASRHYERQVEVLRTYARGNEIGVAMGNLLALSQERVQRGELDFEDTIPIARETLAVSLELNSGSGVARAHAALAMALEGEQALHHTRSAVDAAPRASRGIARGVKRQMAGRMIRLDPSLADEAFRLLAEVEPPQFGYPEEGVRHLSHVASARRAVGPKDEAIAAHLEVLEAVERMRDLQRDDQVRAGTFAAHITHYQHLVSYLLEAQGGVPTSQDVELAWLTMERMRARVLLDQLDSAGITSATAPSGNLADRRDSILDGIAEIQRRLRERGLSDEKRTEAIADLARQELEEREVRAELAAADASFRELRAPEFPSSDRIAGALDEDEAVITFQMTPRQLGGSWAIVVDRRGARAYSIAPSRELARQIAFLLGLIERRDGSEVAAARSLGNDLMVPLLQDLDPAVERLVLLPDDLLWSLPFDALHASDDRPLGSRFEIALAPSATLWLRWREAERKLGEVPALALADPALPGSQDAQPATLREWTLERGMELGPLPRARDEVRMLTKRLGGGSRSLMGEEASERALKSETLARYSILHLAAHAVVDGQQAQRSAIVLAPGADEEDGLLQPREIAALDLEGRIVLLTACRSASGSMLAGEGPQSLARAFFRAGALGVVGSLWPLRDDDSAMLIDALSRHLARGRSVGGALSAARRERIAAGAPSRAWAGLVLIGDGTTIPVPEGRRSRSGLWVGAIAALAIAAYIFWRIARRLTALPGT